MSEPKSKPARGGKSLRSMDIEPHGKEGFSVVHRHDSATRGEYVEPETHIMKTHGELMNHIHDHLSSYGAKDDDNERDCPACGKDSEEEESD